MHGPSGMAALPGKLVAAIVVVAFVLLGLIGVVLPVLPGLVFLALAALIVARHVPWIDARLRRHRSVGPHMHRVDRFFGLALVDQLRVAALVTLRLALDAFDRVGAWLSKRVHGRRPRSM